MMLKCPAPISKAVLATGSFCAIFLTGCHWDQAETVSLPADLPVSKVIQLHAKPSGDSGKKIVRQGPEDQPVASPYNGPDRGKAPLLTHWTPVEELNTASISPGLVVCEPAAVQADRGTADFGAGCGRWLHFSAAGLPQFGQTPLWSSLERAESEMGRTDLRLSLTDAKKLASILGISDVATGQITGSAAHCTLTYQLYAVPSGTAVGPPLQAQGTQAQVLSQLPTLARRLAVSLGVPAPSLPAVISATPAGMTLLGHLAWYPDDTLPAAQIHQLQSMAAQLPLAAFFLVNTSGDLTDIQWNTAVKNLLARQPGNALVWAQIGTSNPSLLALSQGQLRRNMQQFPQNYLYAAADTWMQRRIQNDNAEIQAAEQTVQNAPRNPDAWLTLGSTISEEGERVRQSRLASQMNAQEWQFLNSVYPQRDYAVSRAAQLDPLDGKAWDRVAKAATFDGHPSQADQALWRDIALNKTDSGAYAWGLQMYQSKWGGSSSGKLYQVAQALASIPYPTVSQGLYAVELLRDNEGETDQFLIQRQALLARLLTRTQAAIAHNPGDAQAHYDQAYGLSLAGHKSMAAEEYKNVILLRPADPQAYFDLAQEYDQREITVPALAAYRAGLRLNPASAWAHYSYGWDLKLQNKLTLAETEMRKAIKIAPLYPEAHAGLGQVLARENRNKEATAEMQEAVRLNPFLVPAVGELCSLLDNQGRYADSLKMGRHAVQINPNDNSSMDTMADDYLHLTHWDNSIQMSQAALQVNTNDALAHENLGEAYIGQGKRADARSEWKKVLTMDTGELARVARGMLAKYP